MEEKFPWSLEYRDGGRTMVFSAEMSSVPGAILIFDEPDRLHWAPPQHQPPLTRAESHPIIVRVTAALHLLGIQPIWETMPPDAERPDWPVIRAEVEALLRRS